MPQPSLNTSLTLFVHNLRRRARGVGRGVCFEQTWKRRLAHENARRAAVDFTGTAVWAFPNPGTGRLMPRMECGYTSLANTIRAPEDTIVRPDFSSLFADCPPVIT